MKKGTKTKQTMQKHCIFRRATSTSGIETGTETENYCFPGKHVLVVLLKEKTEDE